VPSAPPANASGLPSWSQANSSYVGQTIGCGGNNFFVNNTPNTLIVYQTLFNSTPPGRFFTIPPGDEAYLSNGYCAPIFIVGAYSG
jgi:hypothetical protein